MADLARGAVAPINATTVLNVSSLLPWLPALPAAPQMVAAVHAAAPDPALLRRALAALQREHAYWTSGSKQVQAFTFVQCPRGCALPHCAAGSCALRDGGLGRSGSCSLRDGGRGRRPVGIDRVDCI